MEETVDGEYQNCKAKGGAYTREKFFGKYPETPWRLVTRNISGQHGGAQQQDRTGRDSAASRVNR